MYSINRILPPIDSVPGISKSTHRYAPTSTLLPNLSAFDFMVKKHKQAFNAELENRSLEASLSIQFEARKVKPELSRSEQKTLVRAHISVSQIQAKVGPSFSKDGQQSDCA